MDLNPQPLSWATTNFMGWCAFHASGLTDQRPNHLTVKYFKKNYFHVDKLSF